LRTPSQELALAFSGEYLWSKTLLLGEPFAFSPGTQDGKAADTALRLTLEWLDRTPSQVLAVRSRFSLGVDVLGATTNDRTDVPDGRFFDWLGQFQYGRRLGVQEIQLLFRLDVQLTTEPLLPLEQIAIGGRFSVRGYRENQLVRDNGLIASLESRIPLVRNTPWADYVQVVPFVDFGRGWNSKVDTPDPKTLLSIGLGLRWGAAWRVGMPLRTQAEVFWGYKLKDVRTEGPCHLVAGVGRGGRRVDDDFLPAAPDSRHVAGAGAATGAAAAAPAATVCRTVFLGTVFVD
jgi:hemolysin activation/secretion protein